MSVSARSMKVTDGRTSTTIFPVPTMIPGVTCNAFMVGLCCEATMDSADYRWKRKNVCAISRPPCYMRMISTRDRLVTVCASSTSSLGTLSSVSRLIG